MSEEKELSEVEKAEAILAEADKAKREEYEQELIALNQKYGFKLDIISQLIINKIK